MISLICFTVAGYLFFRELQFLGHAETAMGTVKPVLNPQSLTGESSKCPLIAFTAKDGQTILFNMTACGDPSSYEAGQQIMVFYDPLHPEIAQADNFWGNYIYTIVALGFGVTVLILGRIQSMYRSFLQTGKGS